jgi:excinuclease ABC subunit A
VRKLLEVLHALVEQGNTVVVIEHNLEVIKTADWIIDLGPEGGDKGGEIVAEGTPEQVAKEPRSYTGQYLAPLLTNPATPAPAHVERSRDTAPEPHKPRRRSSSVRQREAAE